MGHTGIKRTTAADYRRRMLGPEKPVWRSSSAEQQDAENCQHGGEEGGLTARRKTPQQEIADVDQPQLQVSVGAQSHVHQMPQTGRAQIGPVTRTTVQNTTPTSALTRARMSALALRRIR